MAVDKNSQDDCANSFFSRAVPGINRWLYGLLVLLAAFAGSGTTCESQDFEEFEEPLEVDSEIGRVVDRADPILHDRVARHIVDYEITNPTATANEVVVDASSFVNGTERANAKAIVPLEPMSSSAGRITDFELQLGDELQLELQCCSSSTCVAEEVECPAFLEVAEDEEPPTPFICMDRCADPDTDSLVAQCIQTCPGEGDCPSICGEDSACLSECEGCITQCYREAVSCTSTCITLYRRCLNRRAPEFPSDSLVPCDACGDETEGLCTEASLNCQNADCSGFPATCATTCFAEFPDDSTERYGCLERCIRLYQQPQVCDFDPTAVNPNTSVPCCYSEACAGRMNAVLKLGPIECFENSECGSGRQCNERGLCENRLREEQTGCSIGSPRGPAAMSWLHWLVGILGVLLILARRLFSRIHIGRLATKLALGLLVSGALLMLVPEQVSAEPRGFRRTRSSLAIGLATGTFIGGNAASLVKEGLGVTLQQAIQSGYVGGSVRLGTIIHATGRTTIPFDTGLQIYYIAVGPRFVIPTLDTFDFYVYLQPEYQFTGLNSNSIVTLTGNEPIQHGLGGMLGLQAIFGGAALVELSTGYHWLLPVGAGSYSAILSFGFTGLL